ncbi:hypothetical protein EDD21DRAFT_235347 [Dissophora ornata]|nr:hypothetical protein EDD21DRAFT_235347 [Dissophora ornata]
MADSRIVPDEELSDSEDEDGRRNIHDANGSSLITSSPAMGPISASGRLSGRVTTTSATHNFASPLGTANGASSGAATSHGRKFASGTPSDTATAKPVYGQSEWNQAPAVKSNKTMQGVGSANAAAARRGGRAIANTPSQKINGKELQQSQQSQATYPAPSTKGREIHSKEYQPRESHHRESLHLAQQPSQGPHSSQQPPHGQAMPQPPHLQQGPPSHHLLSRDQQQMQMQHQQRDHQLHRDHLQMMREQEQRELEQRERDHHHQLQMHQQRRGGGNSSSSRSEYHSQYSVDDPMMRYSGPPQGSSSGHAGYPQHPSAMHYGQGTAPQQSSQLPPPTQPLPHGHMHSGSASHGGPHSHSHSHSHSLHHHSQAPHGSHPQHVQHPGPPPPPHHHMQQQHHSSMPQHSHHHGPPPPSSQQSSAHHYSGSTGSSGGGRGSGAGMSQGRPGSSSGPIPGMHPSGGYGGPGSGYGGYMSERHEESPLAHRDRKDHYKEPSTMDLDDPRMIEARAPPPPHGGPMPPMGHHSHPSHGGSMDYGRMMPGGPAPPAHYGHRRGGSHGGSQGDLRGAMMGGEPPGAGPYGGWDRERMDRERHHGYRGPNAP